MTSVKKHHLRVVLALFMMIAASLFVSSPSYAQTGRQVDNTATVVYNQAGSTLFVPTNTASFIIEAARTESVIEFFRFAENASNGFTGVINGSQFSPSGDLEGPFIDSGAPITAGGVVLDLSGPVQLAPADRYLAGELIFVRVIDPGQNFLTGHY